MCECFLVTTLASAMEPANSIARGSSGTIVNNSLASAPARDKSRAAKADSALSKIVAGELA